MKEQEEEEEQEEQEELEQEEQQQEEQEQEEQEQEEQEQQEQDDRAPRYLESVIIKFTIVSVSDSCPRLRDHPGHKHVELKMLLLRNFTRHNISFKYCVPK